jgi:hypothetical protein
MLVVSPDMDLSYDAKRDTIIMESLVERSLRRSPIAPVGGRELSVLTL